MFPKFFTYEQAENTDGNSGGGGTPAETKDAPAAQAPAAQAQTSGGTASPEAKPGETSQAAKWDQDDIVWNGQKKTMARAEILKLAQQAYNITQREQKVAAQLKRLDELIAEAEAARGGQGREEVPEDEPVAKLGKEVEALRVKEQLREWEKAFTPVHAKYPDISEKALISEFQERVAAGEAEDNAEGLMKVAEGIASQRTDSVNKSLEALLKNTEDPRLKAYNEKLIADYVAGKIKLANAGGERGGSSTTASTDDKGLGIAEIAARLRG